MSFHKRKFDGPGHLARDLLELAKRPRVMAKVVTGRGALDAKLREKVMLVVTSVNDCRYCAFFHTLLALKEGHSYGEVRELLAGEIEDVNEEEREALLYAQHWAARRGDPDPEARQRLVEVYGEEKTLALEGAIRAIMFGNYVGNTFDAALHVISGGRLA